MLYPLPVGAGIHQDLKRALEETRWFMKEVERGTRFTQERPGEASKPLGIPGTPAWRQVHHRGEKTTTVTLILHGASESYLRWMAERLGLSEEATLTACLDFLRETRQARERKGVIMAHRGDQSTEVVPKSWG